jgi:hypothetical protein
VGKPGMIAANVMSFGMDLVAVGLALTFTHRWGRACRPGSCSSRCGSRRVSWPPPW